METRFERAITGEIVVPANVHDVWQAWVSEAGVLSFFAPACRIDPRPGGAYEILFDLEAAPGQQGGEGMIFLSLQPPRMLSFTWNAPPELPEVRSQLTHVTIWLEPLDDQRTRVTLRHDGWGEGGQWEQAFEYFQRAWLKVVLPRLKYRFVVGPVDWENRPSLEELERLNSL
jgi:uncharacterized protein YndB with AHSA1/START domain